MILDKLIEENSHPIVFIGSGISKRYLTNSPTWVELLELFWVKSDNTGDFYGTLNDINENLLKDGISEQNSRFLTNIQMATIIEESYNKKFNKGQIIIDGLTTKEAYNKNISPFKYELAQAFGSYTLRDSMEEELNSWQNFIRKSQIIITTNYDTFIEDTYLGDSNDSLNKYIGQEGFFTNTSGAAELFKIHGCCTTPNSIVINENDYNLFDKNSILISAKILASLITSPIIFLGYSLSDANVRKIISDFTSQLPQDDPRISENKIIIIERAKNVMEIKENIVRDPEIGSYTEIKTDNYKEIYDKISSINQGLTPYEIRRYQDVIKKLIISEGQKGTLNAVLLSPKDIGQLDKDIDMNKPIVVAMGDKKYMYVMPDFITYIKDYLFMENGILPSVALKFISREPVRARIPFARYMAQVPDLNSLELSNREKENLKNKINVYMQTLEELIKSIAPSNRITYDDISRIWSNDSYSKSKKIDIIIYNIKNFDVTLLDHFMKSTAFPLLVDANTEKAGNLKSFLRKLFYAYDLLLNGDIKPL